MRPIKILLAEDNMVNQKLALALLRRRSAQVVLATNGVEAVEAWGPDRFDLVLMDIQMPEMDGLQATRLIRARETEGEHTPIIAVTARAMTGDREECLAAGMDAYLSKPIRPTELMDVIDRWTNNRAFAIASAATPPPAVAFDGAKLRANLGGDEALISELIELFMGDAGRYMHDITVAARAGDHAGLREAAHGLKGAAGALTAMRVADAADWIERGAVSGASCDAEAIARLETELGTFEGALQDAGLLALHA